MKDLETNIAEGRAVLESLAELAAPLQEAVDQLGEILLRGGTLYTCGNGGSAADASHFAAEILCRYKETRPHYGAVCLSADGGLLTAMANDYGFDDLFARQLRGLARRGDAVAVFSTSGDSPNIRRTLEEARDLGLFSISFLGKEGGSCKGLATLEFLVASNVTARIQEAHLLLYHTLCQALEPVLKAGPETGLPFAAPNA